MPHPFRRAPFRFLSAAAVAVALTLVPALPVAAAPPADPAPLAFLLDRVAGWLGSLGLAAERPASESETSPFMDPDGLTTASAPDDPQAQDATGDSQDASPFMDPNG